MIGNLFSLVENGPAFGGVFSVEFEKKNIRPSKFQPTRRDYRFLYAIHGVLWSFSSSCRLVVVVVVADAF
jgi:hypothetical protein